jgi:hypothetical protein
LSPLILRRYWNPAAARSRAQPRRADRAPRATASEVWPAAARAGRPRRAAQTR